MRLWIWRNLRIELPDDWEMLQFSRESQVGRCAFADRCQYRLELSWRMVNGPLDLARMMSDYLAKLKLDGTMPDAARVAAAGWEGIQGHQGALPTSRFGRYFGAERCVVELVMLWPEGRDAELERGILGSVAEEPEWPGGLGRWKAFGMDLLARSDLTLQECTVAPAKARMTFEDSGSGRQEAFQRLGMVPEWLRGTVSEWLLLRKPGDVAVELSASTLEQGHSIELIRGARRRGRGSALIGRGSHYEAAAWLCPQDGRLYCVSTLGQDKGGGIALPGQRLLCCER